MGKEYIKDTPGRKERELECQAQYALRQEASLEIQKDPLLQ